MKPKYDNKVKLCYMDTDRKQMIFMKILLVTLKTGLILQIMK